MNVQNGVLKALSFMFEYIGEMGKDYIYAITPLLTDALMDRGQFVVAVPPPPPSRANPAPLTSLPTPSLRSRASPDRHDDRQTCRPRSLRTGL